MTQDCSTCKFHGLIHGCKPLLDFHKRLMTRIHGQSTCYYSRTIKMLEEKTKLEPCIDHSDLNQ